MTHYVNVYVFKKRKEVLELILGPGNTSNVNINVTKSIMYQMFLLLTCKYAIENT